jgi:methylmalonyl-CoA epimerase
MRVKRIHHVTIAVRDVDRARETFEALLGATAEPPRDIEAFGVRASDVHIGEGVLQLVSPMQPSEPVMRFIERKGEGFYNLALEVEDLDRAVAELAERGVKVSEPIEAQPGVRSSFVTMGTTHGLSIQLVQTVESTEEPLAEMFESGDEAFADTPPAPIDPDPRPSLDLTPDEWSDVD